MSNKREKNVYVRGHFRRAPEESNGCFIATAAFGSPMAQELNILRKWRDQELLSNVLGRIFVKVYYLMSPPIAQYIEKNDNRRSITRFLLNPLITIIKRKMNSVEE